MMCKFTIPGPPVGKQRARTVTQGGYTHSYTPPKTALYERLAAECYKQSFPGAEAATGAVQVAIRAFYAIPKSWHREKQKLALAGLIPVTVKPDLDNVCKCVMDACNGLAWADDKQVIWMQAQKAYAVEPRVDVEIWQC
jgi:Holliday junction resolvase RusA-like endonuclease